MQMLYHHYFFFQLLPICNDLVSYATHQGHKLQEKEDKKNTIEYRWVRVDSPLSLPLKNC